MSPTLKPVGNGSVGSHSTVACAVSHARPRTEGSTPLTSCSVPPPMVAVPCSRPTNSEPTMDSWMKSWPARDRWRPHGQSTPIERRSQLGEGSDGLRRGSSEPTPICSSPRACSIAMTAHVPVPHGERSIIPVHVSGRPQSSTPLDMTTAFRARTAGRLLPGMTPRSPTALAVAWLAVAWLAVLPMLAGPRKQRMSGPG